MYRGGEVISLNKFIVLSDLRKTNRESHQLNPLRYSYWIKISEALKS
jgi:hypothetical protein